MAKSMRSKWRRKMRAVKVVRVDNKIKARLLQKMASNIIEKELEEKRLNAQKFENQDIEATGDVEMKDATEKKYNSKTLLDKNGAYPKWMNQRAMKKMKRKNKELRTGKK